MTRLFALALLALATPALAAEVDLIKERFFQNSSSNSPQDRQEFGRKSAR
jgi:hypothetical protein